MKIERTFRKGERVSTAKAVTMFKEKIAETLTALEGEPDIENVSDLIRLSLDLANALGYSGKELHYYGLNKSLNSGRFKIVDKK